MNRNDLKSWEFSANYLTAERRELYMSVERKTLTSESNITIRRIDMTIHEAVQESVTNNCITSAEYAGDISNCVAELSAEADEIDYARENDGTFDLWGWNDDMQEGEMLWRIRVTCRGELVDGHQ
jgi:hypothetical protein